MQSVAEPACRLGVAAPSAHEASERAQVNEVAGVRLPQFRLLSPLALVMVKLCGRRKEGEGT